MTTVPVVKKYNAIPTLKRFHESPAQIRCVVGPVGSGKSSAATWEICYYLPRFCWQQHGMKHTRWVVVRNTYRELIDTTQKTFFEWFPWGEYRESDMTYRLQYPEGYEVEIMFRSCDRPGDVKKFKSMDLTGYLVDESIEIDGEIKRMLKNRIGRYPQKSPVRFGVEVTNPPDVEDETYWMFDWGENPPPGPVVERDPLKNHVGFWQPPGENNANLRPGYYDDLRSDYADQRDWIDMYIDGKPGITLKGKLVYHNFRRDYHVAKAPLIWSGGTLIRGWDNSGNTPACAVLQIPTAGRAQILKEFHSDRMSMVDFGNYVKTECNLLYPGASYMDWADPAGENRFSTRNGGFTSNAELMRQECGIDVRPSEQNLQARIESVEQTLARIDGLLIDPSCIRIINGFMGGYCYPKNQSIMGEYLPNILKNKFSHIQDALQYALVKIYKNAHIREDLADPISHHLADRDAQQELEYDPLGRTG